MVWEEAPYFVRCLVTSNNSDIAFTFMLWLKNKPMLEILSPGSFTCCSNHWNLDNRAHVACASFAQTGSGPAQLRVTSAHVCSPSHRKSATSKERHEKAPPPSKGFQICLHCM